MDTTYAFTPISSAAADRLRAAGGRRYVVDADPGYPCRQCLRDAAIGETVILVSHDPFERDSPYRSRSPIFVHEHSCTVDDTTPSSEVPDQLLRRRLSVRAFDREAMMTDAAVVDGSDLAAEITRLFADATVDHLHVHNAARGCWATAVRRA